MNGGKGLDYFESVTLDFVGRVEQMKNLFYFWETIQCQHDSNKPNQSIIQHEAGHSDKTADGFYKADCPMWNIFLGFLDTVHQHLHISDKARQIYTYSTVQT